MATATDTRGNVVKMDVDFSSTVDDLLPKCEALVKNGKIHEALENLLSLEKQTRLGADLASTSRLLVTIIKICFEQKEWELLNEHILILTKRRNQLKQAVTKMIQEAFTYVEQTPNKETKVKFIETLRTVTAGKIYVELERARLTKILSSIKEEDGDIAEAANILQELQVETYGSMERNEKVDFILEQMRLCLAKKDYIRAQIISKKISIKFFENNNEPKLKLRYYQLMIELAQHDSDYLNICKYYHAVFNTPVVQEDPVKWHEALKNVIIYLILAPYDNEQSDLTHRVNEEKKLENIPIYQSLLKCYVTAELMNWSDVSQQYEQELRQGSVENPSTNVFMNTEEGNKRWDDFRKRIVEHNIRIIAKYYTNITMKRMAELLSLPEADTEDFLSNLVASKVVFARIDRPGGTISFLPHKEPNDILNEWSHNINSLMDLLNKTNHLITKEEMVHGQAS
ncbi:26S proteasome non-ATPase regulatory subunit 12-like [Dendronephthya gigantea]|uniref:26S proteasome non-ATPase regulatory subunit 12-like n=1 Tax=Dendronephthya gigantea TaxID=151771 RepID=UPI00106BBB6E|nr:26S proteasome non-ATPase regulatory subunit 12-like [Dendronephthya gigantea]